MDGVRSVFKGFCITFFFYPIHTANLNAIKATGRSNILLKLEIIKDIIGIMVLIVTMQYGTMAIAYGMLACSFISQIINSFPNRKILKYSYKKQILDVLQNGALAFVMGAVVWSIELLHLSAIITLIFKF